MTRLAAVAHSKHRNALGLVGIEINSEKRKISIRLAKEWSREQINIIPDEIERIYRKVAWDYTYIDQLTGQHFIQTLKHEKNLSLKIINTQKNVKNPETIEHATVMDKIEMMQFMVTLKLNHQLAFPMVPSATMKKLESQIALFTEHKTETGNLDYFAPGDEKDHLVKALLIACFGARKYIDGNSLKFWSLDEIDDNSILILNKEKEEGKTGLAWKQVT